MMVKSSMNYIDWLCMKVHKRTKFVLEFMIYAFSFITKHKGGPRQLVTGKGVILFYVNVA